jgi:hypothetical protein
MKFGKINIMDTSTSFIWIIVLFDEALIYGYDAKF